MTSTKPPDKAEYVFQPDTAAEFRKIADELPAYRTTAARDSGVDDLGAALRETFSEDNVSQYMSIRTPNLKKATNDNAIKSSIETGKGTYQTVAEERFLKIEKPVFNLADDALTNHDAMPKYGFIADKRKIDAVGILDNEYGETYIRFKPKVRSRSTITNADSFDGNKPGLSFNPATPLNQVGDEVFVPYQVRQSAGPLTGGSQQSAAAEQMAKWGRTGKYDDLQKALGRGPYTETQIYGKVTLDDVAEILVSKKSDQKTLQALLKKKGHDIPVGSSGHHDRLYKISKGYYDEMASLSPADIDRLGPSYIDKIFNVNKSLGSLNKAKLPDSLIPLRNRLKVEFRNGTVTTAAKRAYLREYFRLVALKKDGGLPKVFWKGFRKTKAGFTDDVLDEALLKSYPDF